MSFIYPAAFRREMKEERLLYWPIALSVAWPLAFIMAWSGPFGLALFGAPLVLVFSGLSAAVALALAIDFAVERSWLRFLAALTLPITVLVAALNFGFVWRAGLQAGEYVHFFTMRSIYLSEISKLPTDEPRLVVYNWGGLLLMVSHGVAFDESDEIALPKRERSEAWKKRAHRTDAECVIGDTPVGNHFYLVNLDC
jgi:hypothetical protein